MDRLELTGMRDEQSGEISIWGARGQSLAGEQREDRRDVAIAGLGVRSGFMIGGEGLRQGNRWSRRGGYRWDLWRSPEELMGSSARASSTIRFASAQGEGR